MEIKLKRNILDRASALLVLAIVIVLFGRNAYTYDIFEKAILFISCAVLLVNSIFINLTPAAKIKGGALYLYAECQPIIFAIKPQIVNVDDIIKLEIRRETFSNRVIFSMPHGQKIYHGFPSGRNARVKGFLEFLDNNTQSEAIKSSVVKFS